MALMNVGGNFQLNTPAALAYLRARSAGLPPGITTATRSYDLQMTWYKNQGKPGYPKWADHPDRSKHVYRPNDIKDQGGRALDLPAGGPREWMTKNGERFGWFRRIKVEPWHFEYEEWNDPSRNAQGDDDMPTLQEIDKVIADRIDERLRHGGTWGAVLTQKTLEDIDKIVASRIDERLRQGGTWGAVITDASKNALRDDIVRELRVNVPENGAPVNIEELAELVVAKLVSRLVD